MRWFARLSLFAYVAVAQERVSVPRADGHMTPLIIYRSGANSCAPLAVISHGAGGSETGYQYLATAMSQFGFTAVVMGHRESGMKDLGGDIRDNGFRPGTEALVKDPKAEAARMLDLDAALQWADRSKCQSQFRVLLGHSMGSNTTMLEAGARNLIGISAGRNRFDAYVALSPEGPGIVFAEHAWSGVRKPILILTGTRDQALKGGPASRQIPWNDLSGDGARKCQWMGVIDGATHMNFGGVGPGSDGVKEKVSATIRQFLDGVQRRSCQLPVPQSGITLQAK